MIKRAWLRALVLVGLLPIAGGAWAADDHGHEGHGHDGHAHDGHAHDDHGSAAAAHGAHGSESGHDVHGGHDAHGPGEINWFYGFVGESEEYEPSILWRPVGTPAPFGAMLLNSGILFFVLYRFGKKPLIDGLQKRRLAIMQGIDEAAKMKEEARGQLAEHQQKLGQISQEIERVREQMKEAAELERQRVLAEARERSERMEREATILIEQELKAAREQLLQATAAKAIRSAEELIRASLTSADRQRIDDAYLETLTKNVVNAPGGRV